MISALLDEHSVDRVIFSKLDGWKVLQAQSFGNSQRVVLGNLIASVNAIA
jgi:hypothetical protein